MSLDLITASDAILSRLKTQWDADTPALNGGTAPVLVLEYLEPDLKPHPKDTTLPWARAVIRHSSNAPKASLRNSDGVSRYRRYGLVWVQAFVPAVYGSAWTKAQQLAMVAQKAYEGKRAEGVVFTQASLMDKPRDGAWVRYDMQAQFYWDEIH